MSEEGLGSIRGIDARGTGLQQSPVLDIRRVGVGEGGFLQGGIACMYKNACGSMPALWGS